VPVVVPVGIVYGIEAMPLLSVCLVPIVLLAVVSVNVITEPAIGVDIVIDIMVVSSARTDAGFNPMVIVALDIVGAACKHSNTEPEIWQLF